MEQEITIDVYRTYPIINKTVTIKTLSVVIQEGEQEEQKIQAQLKTLYNWTKGLHYEGFKFTKKINKKQIIMAKRTTKTEAVEQTESAVDQKGLVVFNEETVNSLNLPAIPKVMNIGGLDFSEESIQKEVDAIKKITLVAPKQTDTLEAVQEIEKVYNQLKTSKNLFVKTRTTPENFRKEVSKPLAEWTKALKAQTDTYGALAKQGEDHCLTQMAIYESWESEQLRLLTEAKEIRVKERSQQLSELQAVKNFESGHWTFPYNPTIIIESDDLEKEFGWEDIIKEAQDSFEVYKKDEEAKREAALKLQEKLKEQSSSLVKMRAKTLEKYEGYTNNGNGSYSKNGHTIFDNQLSSISDDEFDALIEKHNEPAKEATSIFSNPPSASFIPKTTVFTPQQEVAAPQQNHPFTQFESTPVAIDQNEFINATSEAVLITEWNQPYVEYVMKNTTVRFAPVVNQEVAMNGINPSNIVYNQNLGLNLFFVIFKS